MCLHWKHLFPTTTDITPKQYTFNAKAISALIGHPLVFGKMHRPAGDCQGEPELIVKKGNASA